MPKKFAKYMPMSGFPQQVGHALQASITTDKRERVRFFIEMAPQTSAKPPSGSTESPFDWERKKFISLDDNEMGQLLSVFRGREQEIKIIHKYPNNVPASQQKLTGLTIRKGEFKGKVNWSVSLMQKMGDDKPETYQIYLGPGEVEVFMILLQNGISQSFEL